MNTQFEQRLVRLAPNADDRSRESVKTEGTNHTESVREFQPRVCFETLGLEASKIQIATQKELRFALCGYGDTTLAELRLHVEAFVPQGCQSATLGSH